MTVVAGQTWEDTFQLLCFDRPAWWSRYLDAFSAHRSQELKGEGEAEAAPVDAVDEHAVVDDDALRPQPACELFVREC